MYHRDLFMLIIANDMITGFKCISCMFNCTARIAGVLCILSKNANIMLAFKIYQKIYNLFCIEQVYNFLVFKLLCCEIEVLWINEIQ